MHGAIPGTVKSCIVPTAIVGTGGGATGDSPGKQLRHHHWRYLKDMWMYHLGTWLSGDLVRLTCSLKDYDCSLGSRGVPCFLQAFLLPCTPHSGEFCSLLSPSSNLSHLKTKGKTQLQAEAALQGCGIAGACTSKMQVLLLPQSA